MDLAKKREYLFSHVESISRHHDEDAQVRIAMLHSVISKIDEEVKLIEDEVAQRIAELKMSKIGEE